MATNFTLISNQYSANTQNIRKRTVGDSPALYNSEYLRDGHGLLTLSCAIAGENNGNNAPMVGTAPKCFGFYTDRRFLWYDSIDVDGKRDNRITPVDVTYQSTGYGHYYDTLAHNGIVSFLSAGNAIHTNVPVFDPVTNMTTAYLYPMASHGTHHNSFFDARYPNDVSKSIRPITVSGMMDGDLYDQ